MANILFVVKGTAGDLAPFPRIGDALKQRGHQVTLLSHCSYAELAKRKGWNFVALDTPEERQRYMEDGALVNTPRGFPTFFRRHMLPNAIAEFEAVQRCYSPGDTLLVCNHRAGLIPILASEKFGIPVVRLFAAVSELIAMPLMEEMYRSIIAAELGEIREKLELPPVTDWSAWFRLPRQNLALWPEWFASPADDWPVKAIPVGFIKEEATEGQSVPEEAQQFFENGKRPILISAGTGLFTDPKFYAASAQACGLLGHPGLLVTRYPQLIPDDLPKQLRQFDYLPFANLMHQVGAVIHHGGIILALALEVGVPQLVLAAGGDRPDNGMRVQNLGVGECLPPPHWKPETIASALQRLMGSSGVRENCRSYARRVSASDTAADAAGWIEQVIVPSLPVESPTKTLTLALSSKTAVAQTIQKLSPEKQALLAQRLHEKRKLTHAQNAIPYQPRSPGTNIFPLSFAQERLWILDQLAPGSTAYNIFNALRLRGHVDVPALEQGFKQIVQRHESLRTTFRAVEGLPQQVVLSSQEVTLPVVDVSALPQAEREREAKRLVMEEAQRPFDLGSGPLVRCTLLRLADEEYILLGAKHHIISDAWSMGVLFREMVLLAQAHAAGQPSPLPELPLQYADFAKWQREWLQGEVLETQLSYWKRQLEGAPAALELFTDHARPAVQTGRGLTHTLAWSPQLTESLRALSQQEGVTLFMTLLASFQVLLARYSGQDDIVVGSPHANRSRSELEGQVGLFANTLVLRTDLSGNPGFDELLQRVREVVLGAHGHQDLPFEKLVGELQVARDLSRNPLFQVMFIFQNTPRAVVDLRGLTIEPFSETSVNAQFDLTLYMVEAPDSLKTTLIYNSDLFEAGTISRMSMHFQTLLETVVADPSRHIADIQFLMESERHQLLEGWNETRVNYPRDKSAAELFEAQVKRTPDAPALVFEGQQLSYRELNERANRLAHYLRKRGVGPEVLVGICVERSPEMLVGLLGILKAGGAYVPLDPSYPKERLAYMLEDSGAPVLLTQERLTGELPAHQAQLICLDRDWPEIEREKAANPRHLVSPENLAYVIYTSGSTGKPKGVQVLHGALVNFLLSMSVEPGLNAADRLLSVTTLSFDIAGLELYLPLLVGAQVEIASRELASDGFGLLERLKTGAATIMQATPATWRLLLDAGWAGMERLKVLCGGEALPSTLAHALLERAGSLWNMYGPTETTIWSSVARIERADGIAPIGRPIANTQMYVLDGQYQPVPVGVAGELYIGGEGLARGYLNRPDLTAEKFVPDPFGPAGGRLYRTGDLARWKPDGQLEYLRRIDQQVKVRGFRIELGEIETALVKQAGVREAVVIVREDHPGDKRLVAYVVAQAAAEELSINKLRNELKTDLPDYMLPSAFVFLEQLPLTPNGKIDRKALPAPDQERRELAAEYAPPRSAEEQTLAGIWAEVLGLKQVGIHDNFFELGGDSLLAMRVVAQANKAGLHFTPRQIFQHQTLAELAALAEIAPRREIEQGTITGSLPIMSNQHWFLNMNFFDIHHWNIFYMVIVPPGMDLSFVERAIQSLLEHHDALRSRFVDTDSGWQARIVPAGGQVPFDSFDFSGLPAEDHKAAIEGKASELQTSLNLVEGPVLRVAHFNLGSSTPGRLLFIVNHVVADGASLPILIQDFQTAYAQLSYGSEIQLPPKTTSIKVMAERLSAFAKSAELRKEVDYWVSLPWRHTPLPLDFQRKEENTEGSIQLLTVSLTAEETTSLLRDVPRLYNSRIMDALVAALVYAVTEWSGGEWLQVTSLDSGRNTILKDDDIDLSRTVGLLVAYKLHILKREEADRMGDILVSIKDQLRATPHQGVGYDLLLRCSQDPDVVEKLAPILNNEVKFNYASQSDNLMQVDRDLFQVAPESCGPSQNMKNIRGELLYIRATIFNGCLSVTWWYSENLHKRATIEKVANDYIGALRALIASR